jgi:hypothetical protein
VAREQDVHAALIGRELAGGAQAAGGAVAEVLVVDDEGRRRDGGELAAGDDGERPLDDDRDAELAPARPRARSADRFADGSDVDGPGVGGGAQGCLTTRAARF